MIQPGRLADYLVHVQTTGTIVGFHPTNNERNAVSALLTAILQGALPQDPTANIVRTFHANPVDPHWLAPLWDTVPQWGRALMIVQDPVLDDDEYDARQRAVTSFCTRQRATTLETP